MFTEMLLLGMLGGLPSAPDTSPIEREIVAVAARTATPVLVPTAAGVFATFAAPYFPADTSDWTIDLSKYLDQSETFDTLVALTPSLAMTSLGLEIAGGDRRPAFDRDSKMVQFCINSDEPLSLASFAGNGATITATLVFTTTSGNRYHKIITLVARLS